VFLAVGASTVVRGETGLVRFEFQQPHMGTMARVVLYAADEDAARALSRRAFARIAELDARLSDYRDTSELMEVCRGAGGPPRRVSEDLFRVLDAAYRWSERTGGAFDVTIGPVSHVWRRARAEKQPPSVSALEEARRLVGYRSLELDAQERTVRLTRAGMILDVGGIGKGYAADEAIAMLREHGAPSSLVAIGGDIVAGDPPPGKAGWQIAIASLGATDPHGSTRIGHGSTRIDTDIESKVLSNAAVSTSGDAEQFLEHDGKRLSHVLDPSTGAAKVGRRGVTVIAADGMTADALSTAVGVMGAERGFAVVEETPRAAALHVEMTADGLQHRRSKRW
jgi:thiamine biosynthesis lipoprotein